MYDIIYVYVHTHTHAHMQGLNSALRYPGPLLQTKYIHCAYSRFTLRNDLNLSYLRSSSIVQGGWGPCSSESFGRDGLPIAVL